LDELSNHDDKKDIGLLEGSITMKSWYNFQEFKEGFEDLKSKGYIKEEDEVVELLKDPRKEED